MKKTFALCIIAIFLFSLIPAAFAESSRLADFRTGARTDARIKANNNETRAETMVKVGARAEAMESYKERLKLLRGSSRAKLDTLSEEKTDALANLSSDRLQKIAELDKRQIERLTELNVKNLEKISSLKKERLERLAELEKDKLEKIASLDEAEVEKASNLSRGRLKELAKLDHLRLKAELHAIHNVKVKNADDLGRKNVTQAEHTLLRERFDKAKEEFKNAKGELNDERKALKESKEKRDEKATLEHAKNYLLKVSDELIHHLEKLKAKVQENKHISDEQEAKIVAEINAKIDEVAKIKAEVAAATKEQVKEAAKKLREIWGKLKHIIDLHAKRVVAARVEGLVNRGLVLEKKLDNVIEKAKEKGIEINVSAEMGLFSEKIELSRDKHKQAQAKISEALDLRAKGEPADSEKIKALMDESNQLLKESRDALKEAHEALKTIVKKIKEAMPEADLSDDVEVEVEQEAQT